MVESSNANQFHVARVAEYCLCVLDRLVQWSTLLELFPTLTSDEEKERLQNDLKLDEFDRFCCVEENGELFFGLKHFSDTDRRVQEAIEWWRISIAKKLERLSGPMELSKVAVYVERPSIIPRTIKLKDILHADGLNRFRTHGAPNLPLVSLRVSAEEIQELMTVWRAHVYEFLYVQRRDFTLTAIGQHVARPGKLSDKQIKLVEVLRADPQGRFFLKVRSPTDTVVRVQLSELHRQEMEEKWRVAVVHFLLGQRGALPLTEVGASIRRPSIHLGHPTTLRSVLCDDPQGRFVLMGNGPACLVRLSAPFLSQPPPLFTDALLASRPFTAPRQMEQHHRVDGFIAMHSELDSPRESFQMRDLELDLSLFGHTSTNSGTITNTNTSSLPPLPFAPFGNPEMELPKPLTNPLPKPLLHNISVFDDFALPRGGGSPLSVGSGHSTSFTARSRSASQPSPPGIASTKAVGVIGPPAAKYPPLTIPMDSVFTPVLSPLAAAYAPPATVVNSSLYESSPECSHSPSPRSSFDMNAVSTSLSEWLPVVLAEFPSTMVESVVSNLSEEGFLCVKDLVVARSLGQLSAEFLGQVGLKMGHCNRIFARLPKSLDI